MFITSKFKTAALSCSALALVLTACSGADNTAPDTAEMLPPPAVNPQIWPKLESPVGIDAAIEKRIDGIIAKMTLRQKIGQVIQADIGSIKPEDLLTYPLGSVLNGGNSAPNNDNRSPAKDWVALADAFYDASKAADLEGGPFIPILWGTDAVHGHNNIPGATIFPHNIGLGASRNTAIMEKIGDITARETRVTGMEWTFAPTLAVVRDDRWGRTYEGYSENPDVTASFAAPLIRGIQGLPGKDDFLTNDNVIATAKHFVGDGGTDSGRDQGDNIDSEEDLRDIHGAAYPKALDAGVQSVMISFSSWHGKKLTGHKGLITDVLKGQMGFDGFVVSDWNAQGQIAGCTNTNCLAALNAGIDMYMAPDTWKGLFDTMLAQAERGEVDMDRLDDAIRRVLRVKIRSGVMDAGRPSDRAVTGQYDILNDPASKSVARQAVRESLVLLKNNGALPIKATQTVLVAGDGADNIGKQSGGWTFSWQGTGNKNSDFKGGSSVYDGIAARTKAAGGKAVLSVDGSYDEKPDVAVVVFGEDPYAEFQGDVADLAYRSVGDADLKLLQKLKADGIPVVSVFISGRPLWVNREMNASDAFVAAWLPGSEGGAGTADVIMADASGKTTHDFKGKLSYSWPKLPSQTTLNYDDEDYDPLFAFGYGLSYANSGDVGILNEDPGMVLNSAESGIYMQSGAVVFPWNMILSDKGGDTTMVTTAAQSPSGALSVKSMDDGVQENIKTLTFTGPASFKISGEAVNISRQATGDMALRLRIRNENDAAPVNLKMDVECNETCGAPIAFGDKLAGKGEWTNLDVKLSCLGESALMQGVHTPLLITGDAGTQISLQNVEIVTNEGQAICLK